MGEHSAKFAIFEKSREALAGELPNVDEAKDNAEAEQLKALLDELSGIIARRDELKEEYASEVAKMDLAQLCMSNAEASAETVKNLARMGLKEVETGIEEGVAAQEACLEKISTQNELFVASKESDAAQTQREQMLHVLNETCVKFKDNERHLKEGLKFYQDLMADYVLPLKDEIDNFCVARESERDLLLADLGQNVQKLGIDTTGKSGGQAQGQAEQKANEPVQQPQQAMAQQQPPPQQQAQGYSPQAQGYQQPAQPQHPPASGYNPYYSQQPPPQQPQAPYQQQPPPQQQYQQPPQQAQYAQPPAHGYQQPPPQYAPQYQPYQQPPVQQQQYQQPPPQGYQPYPPQQYQQPPPQQQGYAPQQPYAPQQGYNPNYQPPPNNPNAQPSAPPQ